MSYQNNKKIVFGGLQYTPLKPKINYGFLNNHKNLDIFVFGEGALSRIQRLKRFVKSKLEEKTPRHVKAVVEVVRKREPRLRQEYEVRRRRGKQHLKRLVERHIINPVKTGVVGKSRRRRGRRR